MGNIKIEDLKVGQVIYNKEGEELLIDVIHRRGNFIEVMNITKGSIQKYNMSVGLFLEKPKKKIKKSGWINIYYNPHKHIPATCGKGGIYIEKQEALNSRADGCVDTVKIEWEEEE